MRKTLAICLLCVDWQKHKNLFCKAVTRSSNIVAPKKSFVIHNPSRGVFVCKNVAKLRVAWHLFSTAQMINCDQNTTLLSIFEWEAGKTYYNLPGSWSAAGQGRSNRRRGGGARTPQILTEREPNLFPSVCLLCFCASFFLIFLRHCRR